MASAGAQLRVILAPFFPFGASGGTFPVLFRLEHRTMAVSFLWVRGSASAVRTFQPDSVL